MITSEQYAAAVVEKYHVAADTGAPSHHAADEVIPLLKLWGKQYLLGLSVSGSYAKNTAITLGSQVDLLMALKPVPGVDMKGIFWGLFEFMNGRNLQPHARDVSIQVRSKGVLLDLIPACHERESSMNLLFNKRAGVAVQTDVAQHIHLVANSGRQQEICALKIWRERNSLDFPSLYLELTVLHALEGARFGRLADNLLAVLRYLGNHFEHATFHDPANPANIVSNDLKDFERSVIAKAAREVVQDEDWKRILW